jgi:hypothetical protein
MNTSGMLGLEFEWEDKDKRYVKFNNLVKQADNLFDKLEYDKGTLYLYIDELELTLGKMKEYRRDILLIRDLIITIYNFNTRSIKRGFNFRIYASIRSEVLSSVESSGKEINKIMSDFGNAINWHQGNYKELNHPLIKIILRRIKASEGVAEKDIDDELIWNKYFPKTIVTETIFDYILHLTWYRPRDIVRLLTIIQKQFPYESEFSADMFETVKKEYSEASWVELVEELRAKYSEDEVSGIKKILIGMKSPFIFDEFKSQINVKKDMYSDVEQLLIKHKPAEILSDLYRIGVIGNYGQKMRFAFRGDDELLIEDQMMIHKALNSYLSLKIKPNAYF